ncbi:MULTISPECIES: P1 family peptidase [Mesotoga]|jgi:D-aminopeptidase|uniref:P1 family peptidase n=1 Tax=Mesotoga TaxID=1184396 RepID=UPI0002C9119C|nr:MULTISPECIES: P1 family peptidase [Mesotoga]MCP5457060.1 P1 family peptidase [Thermotogota bacterium]CCU83931.1 Peptidase S58 DmpA [Mesotoga infera]MCB1223111.1 P1 family peptidase [Mesotoga sp.]MCP5460279.1 P1 family peptidase [Thermotogota bacterium]RLL90970.1 peptidase S58 [Mesotoga sp. HF07.pep.5.2.highcov]
MRFRELVSPPDAYETGPLNKITDLEGIEVGHFTLIEDAPRCLRTGISVVRISGVYGSPIPAACSVFNGYGKSMGLVQIEELGTVESDIFLTNTLSIGAVQQGAAKLALEDNPEMTSLNVVVMECNDGYLSDIRSLSIREEMVSKAVMDARKDFALGSCGAGTGMICFGYKGGIGSSSRIIEFDGRKYTVGAIVLSNFGRSSDLRIPSLELSNDSGSSAQGAGSLIMILGTDLPLMPHQLKRVSRHMSLAIGLLGAPGHHGSGDISLAFSTAREYSLRDQRLMKNENTISEIFRASAWACVEAIVDSMLSSNSMTGFKGSVKSLKSAVIRKP